MASYNLAAIDSLLKEVYSNKITKSMRTLFPFLDRFQKWEKNRIGGKNFNIPVYMTEGDSVMAYNESGSLATQQGVPVHEMMQVPLTYLSGVFQITGQALENSKGEKWAIEDALTLAKKDLLIQLHRRQTLDFLGNSQGVRADVQANAAAGATAVVIYHPLGYQTDHAGFVFKRGDHIVFEAAAGGPPAIETAVVTSITHGATYDTLNLAGPLTVGVSANDKIYFGRTTTDYEKNLTPSGLNDIFNASATSYMGINLTTYPEFKPYSDTSGAVLSKPLITNFLVDTRNYAGGNPNVLLCNTELIADFVDMFDSYNTMEKNTEIAGGMTKITWNIFDQQIDFFFHDFVPAGSIFAIDEKEMYWGTQKDGGFMPKGGDSVLYRLDGQDVFRADWNKYYSLFTRKLNAHGMLLYT